MEVAAVATKTDSTEELKKELKEEKLEVKRLTHEERRLAQKEIGKQVVTVVSTALAVVAGLFWQTAITDSIKALVPVNGAWSYELGIAILVTLLVATLVYALSKFVHENK